MSNESRSSNVKAIGGPEQTHAERQAAQRSSNARKIDDAEPAHPDHHSADRASNVRPRHERAVKQLNTTDRSSNAQRRLDAPAEPVRLRLSDGPASRQIRGINAYTAGDTVTTACEAAEGLEIACVIALPDGEIVKPEVAAHGGTYTAHIQTTIPGDYWYSFGSASENLPIIVSAEQYFIVQRSRVPRA